MLTNESRPLLTLSANSEHNPSIPTTNTLSHELITRHTQPNGTRHTFAHTPHHTTPKATTLHTNGRGFAPLVKLQDHVCSFASLTKERKNQAEETTGHGVLRTPPTPHLSRPSAGKAVHRYGRGASSPTQSPRCVLLPTEQQRKVSTNVDRLCMDC